MKLCEWCKEKELVGKQRSFCSVACKLRFHRKLKGVPFYCKCGALILRKRADVWKNLPLICRKCSVENIRPLSQEGDKNPNWKGGRYNWCRGRWGRDKDGLSWKKQRQLCWERDNYTCQEPGCGKKAEGWKPDVHHRIPYRISQSHSLENLICLCRKHHIIADRKLDLQCTISN